MAKPKMPFATGTPVYQGWRKVSQRDKTNRSFGQRGVVGDGMERSFDAVKRDPRFGYADRSYESSLSHRANRTYDDSPKRRTEHPYEL